MTVRVVCGNPHRESWCGLPLGSAQSTAPPTADAPDTPRAQAAERSSARAEAQPLTSLRLLVLSRSGGCVRGARVGRYPLPIRQPQGE